MDSVAPKDQLSSHGQKITWCLVVSMTARRTSWLSLVILLTVRLDGYEN